MGLIMTTYPNAKVAALLDGQISIDSSWTEADFRELGMAALDQGGVSAKDQDAIEKLISKCADCFSIEPATVNPEHDDEPRCVSCARDKERRIERLRGGEPDREHIAAMREHHLGGGR